MLCVHSECGCHTYSVQDSFPLETLAYSFLTVFNCIEEYAPGFKQLVVGKEVLTPPDLERIFGLTGGVSPLPLPLSSPFSPLSFPSHPTLLPFLSSLTPPLLPSFCCLHRCLVCTFQSKHLLYPPEYIPWFHVIGPALHVPTNPTQPRACHAH